MTHLFLSAFLISVLSLGYAFAASAKPSASCTLVGMPHPVLIKEQQCKDKHSSTMGIQKCLQDAGADWDKALNTLYQQLLASLTDPALQNALKQAQRNWLAFRDSEWAFLKVYYAKESGTFWSLMAQDLMNNITKHRVKELYEALEGTNPAASRKEQYYFDLPEFSKTP